VLFLDLDFSNFEHSEQLRRGLIHSLHVVIQDESLVARGSDCSTLSIASSFRI
jgi:hypothetical protein